MKLYSLGFIFDRTNEHVLLVHKSRPAWQAGKLNGVGGKAEAGETPLSCVTRECEEDTALLVPAKDWLHFATINQQDNENDENNQIEVFATIHNGAFSDAVKNDHEEIQWVPCRSIPDNAIENLHFLIPMAREHLKGLVTKTIVITY